VEPLEAASCLGDQIEGFFGEEDLGRRGGVSAYRNGFQICVRIAFESRSVGEVAVRA